MITVTESGLTQSQYASMRDARGGTKVRVVAHRYNLDFGSSLHSSQSDLNDNYSDWDSVSHGDYIVKYIYGKTLRIYNISSGLWSNISLPVLSGALSSGTLVSDESSIRLFVPTSSGISMIESADSGQTWTSWTQIYTASNVHVCIAAESLNRVHWVRANADHTYTLAALSWNGSSWTVAFSSIHLSNPVKSMDAEIIGSRSVIVLTCNTPGLSAMRHVDGKVVKYLYRSGGILSFFFEDGIWSEHQSIDIVDKETSYQYRANVKLSKINNVLFLVASAASGSEEYPFYGYRYYTSSDGFFWSRGAMLNISGANFTKSLKMHYRGDFVYAVTRKGAWRSYSTLLTGYSPSALQIDLTDEIASYSVQSGQVFTSAITLFDENGRIRNSILGQPGNTIALQHFWGRNASGELATNYIQVALEEVDSITFNEGSGDNEYARSADLVSRDRSSWLADRYAAEFPYEWQSQSIGADNFFDQNGTRFGGLAHTMTQSGAWAAETNPETSESFLKITSSNKESVSFSSFISDLWNGSYQIGFKLSQAGNDEWAGVVFRGQDKDNFWHATYYVTTDTLKLAERRAGTDTVVATKSAMNWSSTAFTNYHYIRCEFRYSLVNVFYSSNKMEWALAFSYRCPGLNQANPEEISASEMPMEKGWAGQIGKGYSDEDIFDFEIPFPEIEIIFEPPPEFIIEEFEIPPDDGFVPEKSVVLWREGGTSNYSVTIVNGNISGSVTFQDITPSVPLKTYVGWSSPSILFDPFDNNRLLLLGYKGVIECIDPFGSAIWSEVWSGPANNILPLTFYAGEFSEGWFGWIQYIPPNEWNGQSGWMMHGWTQNNFQDVFYSPIVPGPLWTTYPTIASAKFLAADGDPVLLFPSKIIIGEDQNGDPILANGTMFSRDGAVWVPYPTPLAEQGGIYGHIDIPRVNRAGDANRPSSALYPTIEYIQKARNSYKPDQGTPDYVPAIFFQEDGTTFGYGEIGHELYVAEMIFQSQYDNLPYNILYVPECASDTVYVGRAIAEHAYPTTTYYPGVDIIDRLGNNVASYTIEPYSGWENDNVALPIRTIYGWKTNSNLLYIGGNEIMHISNDGGATTENIGDDFKLATHLPITPSHYIIAHWLPDPSEWTP